MSQSSDASLEKVRAAKSVAEKIFTELLGDVAVGITRVGGAYALKVNLVSAPGPKVKLPADVNGVPVRVEVTGSIKKRSPSSH